VCARQRRVGGTLNRIGGLGFHRFAFGLSPRANRSFCPLGLPSGSLRGRDIFEERFSGSVFSMATYHLSAKTVSRGDGQSVVAKAAYNSRDKIRDERTGELKDYAHKTGLMFSGIRMGQEPRRIVECGRAQGG
jgi:hypothetical protein